MLFEQRFWPLIADGTVTVTFRRWKRPQVVAGRRYRTPGGIVEVRRVQEVELGAITNADARRSGYPGKDALVTDLRGDATLPVTRVEFELVDEPDPRAVLASTDALSDDDVESIDARLDRLDHASKRGAWTRSVLETIAARPATRAPDLAASFGRDTAEFKLDVRKLKNLGLTLSLPVGYRLSPRGEAYLSRAQHSTEGQSMSRTMTDAEWRTFVLHGTRTAKVATVRPDGRPHVAPVWFVLDGDDVVLTTGATSVKGRSLRSDPRVSLAVDDEAPPFSFVVIEGTAALSDDLDELRHWATALGRRYMGHEQAEAFGLRNAVPGELLVRVHIERVVAQADIAD